MCLTPLSMTREIGGIKRSVHVPCGHCLECMKDRQNEFAIRSMEAVKKYGSMVFFTLTYNEDSVHWTTVFDDECEMDETTGEVFGRSTRELHRKDLINWKKRVRQAYKRRFGHDIPDFGYVICGEYGPKTHRPHYHGAFYGLSPEVVLMFKADWEYHHGFTCFKNIPRLNTDNHDHVEATSKYIAKYICKVKELEDKLVMNEDVEKPRKITSRGFGMSKDFDKMQRDLLARDLFGNYDLDMLTDENGNRMTNKEVKNLINVIIRRRMYHRNGKDYKLPSTTRGKFSMSRMLPVRNVHLPYRIWCRMLWNVVFVRTLIENSTKLQTSKALKTIIRACAKSSLVRKLLARLERKLYSRLTWTVSGNQSSNDVKRYEKFGYL